MMGAWTTRCGFSTILSMLNRLLLVALVAPVVFAQPANYSGVYPHLAYFNNEGECGTGAVVPFADRLWVITYGPHLPNGSSDKLYEITPDLQQIVRPESIGGTPANRMIHSESNQLFIGPYAIDANRNVRAIPYSKMFGRHTANMRHLTDPANKIYYATMEEGFYEVDVKTLDVKELYQDGNRQKEMGGSLLPGYHGKGAYSGQGRVIYANNGERGSEALRRPDITSGVLASWDGKDWTVVRRNQFTEVTGPGGIHGNPSPATDPIWSVGWDHRSVILMLLDGGKWSSFRLPKASHTYDGAHGWNTEWPRIRDIGEGDTLLMTMHGTFWRFPKTFSIANTAGIAPRSTYLKVIGDFCKWNDRLVFGCDDSAKSEFLNKRKAKGGLAGPGQSNSNLWFVEPGLVDKLGPAIGRGSVWMNEKVEANAWSDPYLFAGYDKRFAHLSHGSSEAVTFEFEVDVDGKGNWKPLLNVNVPAKGYQWIEFGLGEKGQWIRARATTAAAGVTLTFQYANNDARGREADAIFAGLAPANAPAAIGGLVRVRGENKRTLQLLAMKVSGKSMEEIGNYELDGQMKLKRVEDAASTEYLRKNAPIPAGILSVDAASVIYTDDAGKRWRLPRGDGAFDEITGAGVARITREVATERDCFNAHGTFYELPADNAGGFIKVRPITTHNRKIHDYCSYRGMLILTGIAPDAADQQHIVRSDDGKAAVWCGVFDDLWKFGKPVGVGGPWKETAVKANEASDPYLMTGYDRKRLTLSSQAAATITVEIDPTGEGRWVGYKKFDLAANGKAEYEFPASFNAYWMRVTSNGDTTASAQLVYE